MTIFGSSPVTAAVNSSRVDTVVTGPPDPPVVLSKGMYRNKNEYTDEEIGNTYPPFRVAKPKVATSLTDALLYILGTVEA